MKKLGCLLSITGFICFILCIWFFSSFIQQKVASLTGEANIPTKATVAYSTPLKLNQRQIHQLHIKQGRLCQLAVGFLFKKSPDQQQSYKYSYRVLNLKGQKIFVDEGVFSLKDSQVPTKEQWLDNNKALEYYLEAFPVPTDKTIEIRFTLEGQSNNLKKLQLRVYSLQQSTTEMNLSTGIILLSTCFALTIIGLALYLIEKSNELEES